MAKRILLLQHWQIFIIMFVWGYLISQLSKPLKYFDYRISHIITTIIFMLPILGWFWIVGYNVWNITKEELKQNINLFKYTLLFPLIYGPFFHFFPWLISNYSKLFSIPFVIIHLLAVFCMFYNIRFVAKTIVTHEKNQETTVSNYIAVFMGLWFLPIGLWFIQPRIKNMFMNIEKSE